MGFSCRPLAAAKLRGRAASSIALRSLPTAAPRSGMVASVSSNGKAGHQTPAKAEFRLRSHQHYRTSTMVPLRTRAPIVGKLAPFPATGNRQLHFAPLPVTSLMRKQREELWAPHPPEYRKLLRLKEWHQSAEYSAPPHEKRLRASLACCFSHCNSNGNLVEAVSSLPLLSVLW